MDEPDDEGDQLLHLGHYWCDIQILLILPQRALHGWSPAPLRTSCLGLQTPSDLVQPPREPPGACCKGRHGVRGKSKVLQRLDLSTSDCNLLTSFCQAP